LAKKKHLQPSQGSAQKKIQRARVVGEPIPIASYQPNNDASGSRQRSDTKPSGNRLRRTPRVLEGQDQDNTDSIGNTHQDHNPHLESRHNNNEIDFYFTPSTNKAFEISSTAQASTEKQIDLLQHEAARPF